MPEDTKQAVEFGVRATRSKSAAISLDFHQPAADHDDVAPLSHNNFLVKQAVTSRIRAMGVA